MLKMITTFFPKVGVGVSSLEGKLKYCNPNNIVAKMKRISVQLM